MKRQFNLNVLGNEDTLDLSLDKLIGGGHLPTHELDVPKLQSEAAISLAELSDTLDNLCEELLHSEEDILSASSTNDFIDKYAVEALTSIDQLLSRYSTSSFAPPQDEQPSTKLDFDDLLKDM